MPDVAFRGASEHPVEPGKKSGQQTPAFHFRLYRLPQKSSRVQGSMTGASIERGQYHGEMAIVTANC